MAMGGCMSCFLAIGARNLTVGARSGANGIGICGQGRVPCLFHA